MRKWRENKEIPYFLSISSSSFHFLILFPFPHSLSISSFSVHFLILSPFPLNFLIFSQFPHSLSISSQPGCNNLCSPVYLIGIDIYGFWKFRSKKTTYQMCCPFFMSQI